MTLEKIREILQTQNIKKGIFGTYDVTPIEPNPYSLDEYDVIDFMQERFMEIEPVFGGKFSFEDVFFEEEGTEELEVCFPDVSWNSYNWNGSVTVQAVCFIHKGAEMVAVRFHRYGDARCNYTDFVVFNTTWDMFNCEMSELSYTFEVCNGAYEITQTFFDEDGILQVYDTVEGNGFEIRRWELDDDEKWIDLPADLRQALREAYNDR